MIYFALGLVIVVLSAALAWREVRQARAVVHPPPVEDAADTGRMLDRHEQMIEALEERIDTLRLAVAEGIQHVERSENRIKATVRRAREKFAEEGFESPGLDAEAAELRLIDGGGGEEGELPAVRQSVESPQSSIPGVTPEQLRSARGF